MEKIEIIGVELATGESRTFKSMREAEKETGAKHVSQICEGKRYKSSNGWTFYKAGNEKPDLNKLTGEKGRPRKKEGEPKSTYTKKGIKKFKNSLYFFTSERGEFKEKVARYDGRGVLQISYNFYAPLIDDVVPNLPYMIDVTKRRVERLFGRCIYIMDGRVSKKDASQYYIYAELSIKMEPPTEQQLKRLEAYITDVYYEDEEGRNEWNISRKNPNHKIKKYQWFTGRI